MLCQVARHHYGGQIYGRYGRKKEVERGSFPQRLTDLKTVKIRLMWEAYLSPRDIVLSGLGLLPRAMSMSVALLQSGSATMSMAPITTKG